MQCIVAAKERHSLFLTLNFYETIEYKYNRISVEMGCTRVEETEYCRGLFTCLE